MGLCSPLSHPGGLRPQDVTGVRGLAVASLLGDPDQVSEPLWAPVSVECGQPIGLCKGFERFPKGGRQRGSSPHPSLQLREGVRVGQMVLLIPFLEMLCDLAFGV